MKKAAVSVLLIAAAIALAACSHADAPDADGLRTDGGRHTEAEKNEEPAPETELISVVTPLNDRREGRIENIRLVCETLSGKVLSPGEEFSFNESVGRRTMARGFKKAVVFKDSGKEKEVGGGICQVSSALYKAAKDAGLTVTERHEHGMSVDYVPKGEDATVYYGELDLKFINSSDRPIRMDFHLGSDELTVTLTSLGA
ncbi:MAG: VanW family protein [Clostridia bacterium]|nr:VanW family protein [Clostridia bacterium]MBQ1434654.1 VanW family protein [Clostridia bacterium]MBQ4250101.1 VanW family protein [Clostridia bacterium]